MIIDNPRLKADLSSEEIIDCRASGPLRTLASQASLLVPSAVLLASYCFGAFEEHKSGLLLHLLWLLVHVTMPFCSVEQ